MNIEIRYRFLSFLVEPKFLPVATIIMSRSALRNVFLYDLRDLDTKLGGLFAAPGITNEDFYTMVEIVLIISSPYVLQDERGEAVPRNNQPLLPGNYLVAADSILINNETVYTRAISVGTGPRVHSFKQQVRDRDHGCVVSKRENLLAAAGLWEGFQSAHIFPLAYEQHWTDHDYGRWITIDPPQGGGINSVQNGLCLRSDLHQLFDSYLFSINPDVSFLLSSLHPYRCRKPHSYYNSRLVIKSSSLCQMTRILVGLP
ncbi:hypothetical protein V8C37DRAFT_384200 [Trichoderma ceciliae]